MTIVAVDCSRVGFVQFLAGLVLLCGFGARTTKSALVLPVLTQPSFLRKAAVELLRLPVALPQSDAPAQFVLDP